MMDVGLLGFLPLLLIFLAFIALVDVLEVSLTSIRGENLEKLAHRNVPGARKLERLLRTSPTLLSLSLAQIKAIALVATFVLIVGMVGALVQGFWVSLLLGGAVSIGTFLTVQGLAYRFASPAPERVAIRLVPLAAFFATVSQPFTRFTVRLPEPGALLAGENGKAQGATEETGNGEAHPRGGPSVQGYEVEEHEREMIRAILRLEDTAVREIMVPLPDIVAVDKDTPLGTLVDLITEKGVSRVPIYEGAIDNILGVVYAKDILAALKDPEKRPSTLLELSRQAFLIPETKRLNELLRDFQEKRVHIGIVIDEYGGVAGLVTIEDLLEEIVGEIEDEYDTGEPEVERVSENEVIIDAKTPLDLLNELFATEIEGKGFDTVGGLIYHHLGKVPVPGDSVREDGIQADVLTTVGRRIRKVRVRRFTLADTTTERTP